ncbi:MAG: hypothetical protein QOG87_3510 [Actinomycetota bacterium]|jgi:very-short-patch-repair endonuclease
MRKVLEFAAKRYSVFTRGEAIRLGATPGQLRTALRSGIIERAGWGIYRVTGSVETWRQKLMIAVLAAGPGAAVSGRAAAALWRLPGYRVGPVVITQPRRPSRRFKVAHEHSSRFLPEHHVRVVDGIPVTSPERTAFDLCAHAAPKRALRLVKTVISMRLTTYSDLAVTLAETFAPARPGSREFRAALAKIDDKPVTESELEDLVEAVLRAAGLELPVRQAEVGGTTAPVGRIDFLYRVARLVIEADSKQYHGNWLATEADHRRDKLLIAAGYQVIRTNWHELIEEPDLLVNAVRAVLQRAA